jgi:hypothetical protein
MSSFAGAKALNDPGPPVITAVAPVVLIYIFNLTNRPAQSRGRYAPSIKHSVIFKFSRMLNLLPAPGSWSAPKLFITSVFTIAAGSLYI